jgi:hypothetical protein
MAIPLNLIKTDADRADETDKNPSNQRNPRPKFLSHNKKSLKPFSA